MKYHVHRNKSYCKTVLFICPPPPAQLIFVIGDKIVMDGDIKRALLIAKDGAS